ncbi:Cold-shock protein DNA-binding [Trinorchestia longiramus]|nr:Cold-shock protein DNA-binding [Trinorchestia longiramus]
MVEVKFGERDQRGEFTLRHGDWVEFNIATDRRDRLQKATNITLLDDSFTVSGERREQGVVKHLIQECGYILCCDRDLLLHFHYRELLDPSTPVTIDDELAFTVTTDSTLTGPRKETATRIARLSPGTVAEGVLVQDMLQGQVNVVAEKPPPLLPPNNPGSVVPPKDLTGEIVYFVEGVRQSLAYSFQDTYPDLVVGDKVRFCVQLSKRHKKMVATDLVLMSEVKVPNQPSTSEATNTVASDVNVENSAPVSAAPTEQLAVSTEPVNDLVPVSAVNGSSPKVNSKKASAQKSSKQPRQSYQGYVAALKESFGFIETLSHDKEIFFHFSNVEGGDTTKLELGDEVEYSLSSRTGPGGKVSAENITLLPKGTLPQPKVLETVYNGLVIRPIRSSNPDQTEYCGLLAVDTDDVERSEQYKFGISGVVRKRELLQKADTVTFQVDATGWATCITAVRKKLIATVDTVKGQYGFLNYEAEEGKKLFFHQSEVKDKTTLSPGDEVEFVIITNQKTGKSSACNISRIMSVGGQSRRPQRLISQLKTMSVDQSKPRLLVVRQPKGPDGTKGFSLTREQLALNFAGLAF